MDVVVLHQEIKLQQMSNCSDQDEDTSSNNSGIVDSSLSYLSGIFDLYTDFASLPHLMINQYHVVDWIDEQWPQIDSNSCNCEQELVENRQVEMEELEVELSLAHANNENLQRLANDERIKYNDEVKRLQKIIVLNKRETESLTNELNHRSLELSTLRDNLEFFMDPNTQLNR